MLLKKRYVLLLPLLLVLQTVKASNPPTPLNTELFQQGDVSHKDYNSFEWNDAEGKYIYDRAHTPPLRYTDDGRVGVYGISINNTSGVQGFHFNVLRPEAIDATHHSLDYESRKGFVGGWKAVSSEDIKSELNKFGLLANYGSYRIGSHITMCDPTQFIDEEFTSVEPRNPYRCGVNGSEECYNVNLIGPLHKEGFDFAAMNLYSLPVTIKVSNPKTQHAAISELNFRPAEAEISDESFIARRVFEPIVAGDGRLLIFRVSGNPDNVHQFYDGNTLVSANDVDIVYSVYDKLDSEGNATKACDVNGWNQYYPITFAHHDTKNEMKDRYKFANQVMRDPSGNPYDKYEDTGATYPWIDKDAANLAFTIINKNSNLTNTNNGVIRYSGSCTGGFGGHPKQTGKCDEDGLYGVAVNGMWTRWKTVLLDGVVNPADFGLHWAKDEAVDFQFYNDAGLTRVSGVRAVESERNLAEFENGFPTNTTIIDTIENSLNYIPEMVPQTPRDTVWKFGNSLVTTELAFDDYINDDFLINASMTGLVAYLGQDPAKQGVTITRSRYFDGFDSDAEHTNNDSNGTTEPIRFQNSATNTVAPSYGVLEGAGRVEPIAAGGIYGKGLYLTGTSRLSFMLEGNNSGNPDMYVGLFVNQRELPANVWQPLLQFPKSGGQALYGTEVYILRSGNQIRLKVKNFNSSPEGAPSEDGDITLPAPQSNSSNNWVHIGLEALNLVGNPNSHINVYQNGNLAGNIFFNKRKVFLPRNGSISLGNFAGHSGSPITAWFDELKVKQIAVGRTLNKEEICNHARGTFIYDPVDTGNGVLRNYAATFEGQEYAIELEGQNSYLNDQAGTTNKKFVCLTNYVDFNNVRFSSLEKDKAIGGHTSLIQAEALGTSARTLLTHPESLHVDPNKERPGTDENEFCLSCHNYPDTPMTKSLSVEALKFDPGTIFKKGPRQPSQPPATISGLIPASLSNPPRWAQTIEDDGTVKNYEYIDDLVANPSPPKSKVVFVKFKNYLIPIATD